MKINSFSGESGYYEIAGQTGPSPDIEVRIGQTYVFDQRDASNWYHPVGFAYYPDGAHGATWGGAERDEVEGLGELLYKIDGAPTTCPDAGDTGLDCYEPEFFYPRDVWIGKTYTAELTITQAVAERSHRGVIYYFCHIHSKMSGKIQIMKDDGYKYTNAKPEKSLYSPVVRGPIDRACGTTGVADYAEACSGSFLCGNLTAQSEPRFGQCLQGVDCAMNAGMFGESTPDHHAPLVTFMEQMIPHHLNAINMAKLLLKADCVAVRNTDGLEGILWEIISVQNFQVHQFRNYLQAKKGNTGVGAIPPGGTCEKGDTTSCFFGGDCVCVPPSSGTPTVVRRNLLFGVVPEPEPEPSTEPVPQVCTCQSVAM